MSLAFWVQNVGDRPTQGPISVVNTFTGPVSIQPGVPPGIPFHEWMYETTSATPIGPTECHEVATSLSCEITGPLQPGVQVAIEVIVTMSGQPSGTITDAIVTSGGGAPGVSEERSIAIASPGGFAFDGMSAELLNSDGSPDLSAGSVPAEFTTKLRWKSFFAKPDPAVASVDSDGYFKDVVDSPACGSDRQPVRERAVHSRRARKKLAGTAPRMCRAVRLTVRSVWRVLRWRIWCSRRACSIWSRRMVLCRAWVQRVGYFGSVGSLCASRRSRYRRDQPRHQHHDCGQLRRTVSVGRSVRSQSRHLPWCLRWYRTSMALEG